MSESLRRWLLFGLFSTAVLLGLILYVMMTGPEVPVRTKTSGNSRVIQPSEAPESTLLNFVPASPDAVIVLRQVSEPWKALGIIDDDWRVSRRFREANSAQVSQIERQFGLDLSRGLGWLERKMLPTGVVFASVHDVGTSPWGVLYLNHATPNSLRSMIVKAAQSNGFEVSLDKTSENISMGRIGKHLALSGSNDVFIAVFSRDPLIAAQRLSAILESKQGAFKSSLDKPLVDRLENPPSSFVVHIPDQSEFGRQLTGSVGVEGPFDFGLNVLTDRLMLSVEMPME